MSELTEQSSASDILAFIEQQALFGRTEPTTLQRIVEHLTWFRIADKETLFRQGELSEALFILVSGRLLVSVVQENGEQIQVGTISPRQMVGEIQVLSGGARTATVQADEDSLLLRLSGQVFHELGQDDPALIQNVATTIQARNRHTQLILILPRLFGTMDADVFNELVSDFEWVQLPRGHTLFEQDAPGDSLYIVINGRLEVVVRDSEGRAKVVGMIERGECVGEMALLTGAMRTARVHAIRDSDLVCLSKEAFYRLLVHHPNAIIPITNLIIRRFQKTLSGASTSGMAISMVVLPAGDGVPLSDCIDQLVKGFTKYGPALHLNARLFDTYLGTPGIAQIPRTDSNNIRITTWLSEQEARYRFIIYETDFSPSHWTDRCLHQADEVLIIGRAADDPAPGPIERMLEQSSTSLSEHRQILMLLHPPDTEQPSGTARWLDVRQVDRHHHVRETVTADFERVARFLAGQAVGVALSGGGARGFAHVGALQALAEAGIPVDMVGGTSMGAYIAAEYALGWTTEKMVSTNQRLFTNTLYDVTLPIVSIVRGKRLVKRLKKFYGEVLIEDLWLPYFSVSSNLSRAEIVIHKSGRVRDSIRASGGLQGLLPPVIHNGDLLVDGALLSNLPVDALKTLMHKGTLIAVDVSPPVDLSNYTPYGESLSGWRLLLNKINPLTRSLHLPGIATTLQRAGELASIAHQKQMIQQLADLYIRMPVEQFPLFDFKAADKIIETGYRHAQQVIAEWQPQSE